MPELAYCLLVAVFALAALGPFFAEDRVES